MNKERKRKRNARHADAMAKKFRASQNHAKEIPASSSPMGTGNDFEFSDEKKLTPICPDPGKGFQPLSTYLVKRITAATMDHMERFSQERHIPLDLNYWKKITQSILKQSDTDTAIICTSPAGSGKSTWISSFLQGIHDLFATSPELETSLVGIVVVLQKVEDLNCLAEALNQGCSPDDPFMVPLQGWNASGKKRGFCQNSGIEGYADCPRARCPYAAQCPILEFREKAPYAPVVGLTQERFYLLREDDLTPILKRKGSDMKFQPRRYILFDEKFQMVPVTALSAEQINEASTEFNNIISKYDAADTRVRSLQERLNYSVFRPFQQIRKLKRTETGKDIPVGFLSLSKEASREAYQAYLDFQDAVCAEGRRLLNKPLTDIFCVMDYLWDGNSALFTKTNGFCIYRIDAPQLHFGDCQTIIFDATAEVDNDYRYLDGTKILSGTPKSKPRTISIHIHSNSDMNVSKSAMKKPWKLPGFAEYIAGLIKGSEKKVFLCTYKNISVELAERLREELSESDFSKILFMPDKNPPMIPYFNGTNGSNIFKDAEMVIMLGFPRLDPATYLSFACAACGATCIAEELRAIPEEKLLDRSFNSLNLPSVRDYVAHHLAARLEQEIYRCAQRNPGFTGEISIHLFCPPGDVLDILRERIHGNIIYDHHVPDCITRWKGAMRQYDGGSTSFGRLTQFLDDWDGTALHVTEIQERLAISPAVWKDLIADQRVQSLLEEYGIQRMGRGPNTRWQIPAKNCA